MVQHWITMQKVAGSSLLGVTFAMNRQYFSYTIGKSLHVRVFCSTEESNIIGKILSPHHSGSKNKQGQQTKYSTPEQFNLRHPSSVSNLSVNFFHSVRLLHKFFYSQSKQRKYIQNIHCVNKKNRNTFVKNLARVQTGERRCSIGVPKFQPFKTSWE